MRLLSVLALTLGLAACDSAAPDAPLRVDMTPGHRLEYAVSEGSESLDGERTEDSWTSTAEVVALDAAVGAHVGLTEVLLTSTGPDGGGRVWYQADDDVLAERAYDGGAGGSALRTRAAFGSPALPIPVRRLLAEAVGSASSEARVDPVVRSEPRVVLAYPAEVGREWVHYDFTGVGFPLRSLRRIEGEATVETPAGSFPCLVVRTTVEFAGVPQSVDWVDYVAEVGLVLREMTVRNPEEDETGVETGRAAVSTFRQELTAVVR